MCGRYALGIRAAFVRHRLRQDNMQVDEFAEDDETRETYNFAPGYNGLVYRANVPDTGARTQEQDSGEQGSQQDNAGSNVEDAKSIEETKQKGDAVATQHSDEDNTKFRLQAMRWGLIPFWTKRNPDYGSMLKTINCRDDSLLENRGMWTTMKKSKRCIVIAQGFYEWLKKNGGKEKIPHYMKRKDDKLMCFAGLWDCVKYEGSEDKVYTYTIITTDSNKQLKFLHDRMPVILENGSEEMRTWLDPKRTTWSKELQSLLKPFQGELECYAVSKDVGKVGNNSPDFIVPVASTQNKSNIANFFANAKKPGKGSGDHKPQKEEKSVKVESNADNRSTADLPRSEDNAPMPQPNDSPPHGVKRLQEDEDKKVSTVKDEGKSIRMPAVSTSPSPPRKKLRSSTSNGAPVKSSPIKSKGGNQRITSFFNK